MLNALLKVDQAGLLIQLFGRVVVPAEVYMELSAGHSDIPSWLEVLSLPVQSSLQELVKDLHLGEAAAIALAELTRPDYLLMDERKGRRIAKERGIPVLGLAGVLVQARRRGIIDNVRLFLLRLRSEARFRISDEIIDLVAAEFGD